MVPDGKGRVRLDYKIPSRGMIGFQTDFRTMTSGTGLMYHVFDHFGPVVDRALAERSAGVMISNGRGPVLAYALFNLQERGTLFVGPGDLVYEGQIVGETSREGDMVVNPLKGKKLTNIRTQSKDENVLLDAADPHVARAGHGIHRRRRAGRSHAEEHPPAQAPPERRRPEAGRTHRPERLPRGRTYLALNLPVQVR